MLKTLLIIGTIIFVIAMYLIAWSLCKMSSICSNHREYGE